MGKRQEIRARRRRQQMTSRITVIILVILGALLITAALALPSINNANLKATQMANLTQTPIATIVSRTLAAPVDKTSMGDPSAPVKMDVWEDFQCSACLIYSQNTEPLVIQNYVETGKVYYVFHFFPAISSYAPGNTESEHSANAAMCAADQGKFWEYHDILFANWIGENVGGYNDNRLVAFAGSIGLNMTDFNKCFDSDKHGDFISQDASAGQNFGVHGTPAIFVNGVLVVSPRDERAIANFEEIAAVIENALAGK
jgi:protein-disulfide isomerase